MVRLYSLLLCFVAFGVKAQISTPTWGVNDTICNISKTTDYGIVHDYIELFNYSGENLDMRWILDIPPSWPSQWDANFADPSNTYPDVLVEDSAEFVINDPIGFDNKMIIGVQHHSYAYTSYLRFKVFPIEHPEDSLWLYFNTTIAQGAAYFGTNELSNSILFQNHVDHMNIISNEEEFSGISIFSLEGKLVFQEKVNSHSIILNKSDYLSGIYIVNIATISGKSLKKKIVIN